MSEKPGYIKINGVKNFQFFNIIILFISSSLCLIGFLGPGFWNIASPKFKFIRGQKDLSQIPININKIDKLNLNKNYLSSDQINEKTAVIAWSKQILDNVKNKKPLARMYFTYIPKNINKYENSEKKKVFLSLLLPIALRGNELVIAERKLMKIAFLTKNIYKIEHFAKKYNVQNYKKINFSKLTNLELNKINKELLLKINQIPVSMMLAQAIIESGWGSSRFAQKGNALFGEWTWNNNKGIKPKGSLGRNFAVKSFKNISDSLNSYILNLNSHSAYKEMRNYRALMYKTGKDVNGYETANFLKNYAEIGSDYITKVINIINSNKLYRFENCILDRYYD